jgi:hypothetical protein
MAVIAFLIVSTGFRAWFWFHRSAATNMVDEQRCPLPHCRSSDLVRYLVKSQTCLGVFGRQPDGRPIYVDNLAGYLLLIDETDDGFLQ